MNEYPHIHADFQQVMNLPDQERIRFMDLPRWINYPQATLILDTLRDLLEKAIRPRMPNLLLIGDSNNGKTTIIRHFQEVHGVAAHVDDGDPVIPIILAEAPPSADEKGLYISILERFFTPYRATDPTVKLRYQVIHLLRLCRTRILIIDEFHSLLTGTPVKQREVMNAIKLLCNELAIPIVGVGTRDAVRVLHMDPQHASRFEVIALPSWTLNQDFQRLLAGFEKILPLKYASKIYQPETAALIHTITEGNIGNVHRLLVECAREAIITGSEKIDRVVIENKAWIRPTKGIREISL